MKIMLNPDQKVATRAIKTLQGQGLTLLGEGGTGKTTCIMDVVMDYAAKGLAVLLTAPTNKAVKQLEAAARAAGVLDKVTAMTIHKALGLAMLPDEENKYAVKMGSGVLHNFQLLVIDEGSMLSRIALQKYILPELNVNPQLRVVIMGDGFQLPPVKENESLALQVFPSVTLTKVERFEDGSGISKLTTALRQSLLTQKPFTFTADYGIRAVKPVEMDNYILSKFTVPEDVENTRVLAWTNTQVDYLNGIIREKLHGKNVPKFVVGERVVTGAPVLDEWTDEPLLSTDEECVVVSVSESSIIDDTTGEEYNTYYLTLDPVYAKIGQVKCHVLHEDAQMRLDEQLAKIARRAKTDRKLWSRFHELKDLFSTIKYCYCITVHRSQGSTYPNVIVDVRNIQRCRDPKMARRLLYVACSRASKNLTVCRDQFTI